MKKNSNFDKELKQYLHSIKTEIHSPQKSKFLRQLENSILLFADEHDVESMDAIIEEFGSPKAIAASFLEESDSSALSRSLKIKKRIVIAIISIMLLLSSIIAIIMGMDYLENQSYRDGHFVETIQNGANNSPGQSSTRADQRDYK